MIPFEADYYDGKSAKRIAATIRVVGDVVVVAHTQGSAEYALSTTRVQSQLKGVPCRIGFPDGAVAITNDHAAVKADFGTGSAQTLAHRLESHLGFVITALVGIVVTVALGYFYGVPWAAHEIAKRLPDGIESQLAEASIKSLDQVIFKPSSLNENLRAETLKAFAELRVASDLPSSVRMEFRDGGWIGANALALPGGVIVITDQLISAMPGVPETAAVLAHELGHVQHRHSLRQVLQSSITALAAAAVYGDVGSLTTIAVTAPTVLAHNGYSRDFEREADTFAFALLKKTGRSPTSFAIAMRKLEKVQRDNSAAANKEVREKIGIPEPAPSPAETAETSDKRNADTKSNFGYLSTHPATAERIRAAEAAAAGIVP